MFTELRTKYADNGRITLNKEIANLMIIREGDYIQFVPDKNDRIYIRKESESDDQKISERVKKYAEAYEIMRDF